MVPTAPEPGDAVAAQGVEGQRLSPEAAWGMRALIMVIMFLVRWFGREPAAAVSPAPADDVTPAATSAADRAARAERVAKGAIAAAGGGTTSDPAVDEGAGRLAQHRRRAVYASALTAAGTAAWMAGRRSGRRR